LRITRAVWCAPPRACRYGNENGFTSVEITPSEHGAVIRYRFPTVHPGPSYFWANQTRRIMVALNALSDVTAVGVDAASGLVNVSGYTTANSGGVQPNFAHYFYITIGGGEAGTVPITPFAVDTGSDSLARWATLDFDMTDMNCDVITLRVATSLISPAQAGREAPHRI
jgi:hypothetical protein